MRLRTKDGHVSIAAAEQAAKILRKMMLEARRSGATVVACDPRHGGALDMLVEVILLAASKTAAEKELRK